MFACFLEFFSCAGVQGSSGALFLSKERKRILSAIQRIWKYMWSCGPRDGGAWWAAVRGVAQSRTWGQGKGPGKTHRPCSLLSCQDPRVTISVSPPSRALRLGSQPNGYLLSPQSGLKGVRPPVEFEEMPRDALQAMQEKKAFISRRR